MDLPAMGALAMEKFRKFFYRHSGVFSFRLPRCCQSSEMKKKNSMRCDEHHSFVYNPIRTMAVSILAVCTEYIIYV